MTLTDKVAIVTGTSTGIGRAISVALAKENYHVLLVARNETKLQETKQIINNSNGSSEVITCDLSKIEEVNDFITKVKSNYKTVNVLVNVAGIWHGKDEVFADKEFETFSQKVILDTFNVGTITPTLLSHAFIPFMPKNGKIINISGTFENGAKGWLPYFVSKKAIEDLTIGLAEELKGKDIQVNCISPSDTATEAYGKYFPEYMDEAISPEEIAKHAVYLVSDEANMITGKVFVLKKGKEPYEGYHT